MPQQSTGGAVMRNGLIFGAIIAALDITNNIIRWLIGGYDITTQANGSATTVGVFSSGVSAITACVLFLVTLGLTFVAGMLTTRRTGGVGSGSLTGMVAGAFGALIGGIADVVVILTLIAPNMQPPAGSDLSQSQIQGLLIGTAIFGLIFGLFLYGGFGAGMGALGGLVGRNSYLKANPPQPYQESFYPGFPGGPWQPGGYYPPMPYPGAQYPAPPYGAPPPYAGPQYPAPPYPGAAGYPPAPTPPQPQEP